MKAARGREGVDFRTQPIRTATSKKRTTRKDRSRHTPRMPDELPTCIDTSGPEIVHLAPDVRCTHVVPPTMVHTTYQPIRAVFVTQTVGSPMGNQERNGNDWYKASSDFTRQAHTVLAAHANAQARTSHHIHTSYFATHRVAFAIIV